MLPNPLTGSGVIRQVYDPAADSWTTKKMPLKLHYSCAAVLDGKIWLFAALTADKGNYKLEPCEWAFRYSPSTNTWTKHRLGFLKSTVMNNTVATIDGRVYFTSFNDRKLRKTYRVDLRNPGPGVPIGEPD